MPDQLARWHTRGRDRADPVPIMTEVQTKRNQMRLDVICPAAPWENTTTDADRAWDLCYSLSEEFGYAEVRQDGIVIGDYGNPATFLDWR